MTAKELDAGRRVRPFELSAPVEDAFYLVSPVKGISHPGAKLFREWLLDETAADARPRRAP